MFSLGEFNLLLFHCLVWILITILNRALPRVTLFYGKLCTMLFNDMLLKNLNRLGKKMETVVEKTTDAVRILNLAISKKVKNLRVVFGFLF